MELEIIHEEKNVNLLSGDFLVVKSNDGITELRQIVARGRMYHVIDIKRGMFAIERGSINEIINEYKKLYSVIGYIKNSDIKIVANKMEEF